MRSRHRKNAIINYEIHLHMQNKHEGDGTLVATSVLLSVPSRTQLAASASPAGRAAPAQVPSGLQSVYKR